MKKLMIPVFLMVTLFAACDTTTTNKKTNNAAQPETKKEQLFACPMHPEVTGKKGDKCTNCGMELTEPVK